MAMGGAIGGALALSTNSAIAQIRPDSTLPNNSTVRLDGSTHIIEGGTRAGGNLFHSFGEFSVRTGETAHFNNAADVQNIFGRVTGGAVSNIDGILQANGTANLFMINPNGIIFGKNASLNIGGSFLGTTASSLKFADGTEFSATAPQSAPLLTISVPIGLQFGGNVGSILNQSVVLDSSGIPVGLQVQPGKTLALVGGDVALLGGNLTAKAGRIELGSVVGSSLVSLTPTTQGWMLGYEGVQNFMLIFPGSALRGSLVDYLQAPLEWGLQATSLLIVVPSG
ncbi:MAG: filamentous hemagglutinin N-terminal domain-containing protein [Stigonema ocellatum SAG 48.90 = DSM 106950]|nr:filamentous hemagglutinin N-terminal domain-containing protein [Stigonema ocellatum SAG 48.90 = DSM 106950]